MGLKLSSWLQTSLKWIVSLLSIAFALPLHLHATAAFVASLVFGWPGYRIQDWLLWLLPILLVQQNMKAERRKLFVDPLQQSLKEGDDQITERSDGQIEVQALEEEKAYLAINKIIQAVWEAAVSDHLAADMAKFLNEKVMSQVSASWPDIVRNTVRITASVCLGEISPKIVHTAVTQNREDNTLVLRGRIAFLPSEGETKVEVLTRLKLPFSPDFRIWAKEIQVICDLAIHVPLSEVPPYLDTEKMSVYLTSAPACAFSIGGRYDLGDNVFNDLSPNWNVSAFLGSFQDSVINGLIERALEGRLPLLLYEPDTLKDNES